jgi:hypothetical protein
MCVVGGERQTKGMEKCKGKELDMIDLVKFECGCIGLQPNKDNVTWLVESCDDRQCACEGPKTLPFEPRNNMTVMYRGKEIPKQFRLLSELETKEIMNQIRKTYYDGIALQTIKKVLIDTN